MKRISTGRFLIALILILLGCGWLLNRAGVCTVNTGDLILHYWPVVFIYLGIRSMYSVASQGESPSRASLWVTLGLNLLLTLLFVGLLGNTNGWWSVDLSPVRKLLLPAVLLFLGIGLFSRGVRRPGSPTYWAVMSGSRDVRFRWDDLAMVSIMGGVTLDLSQADLPEREVLIDAYSLMGGGEILVPPGVKVVCEQTTLLGGVNIIGQTAGGLVDRRVIEAGGGPVVRVRAITVMGGFDVKQGTLA